MKYKAAIIESLNTTGQTTITVDGKEYPMKGKIPFSFPNFIMNLSAILVGVSDNLLLQDFPLLDNSDDTDDNKSEMTAVLRVLVGADLFRHFKLFEQTHKFLDWLLEEEIPILEEDADDWDRWYDAKIINAKWNEFASFLGPEEQQ